jgi:hypothetical protein
MQLLEEVEKMNRVDEQVRALLDRKQLVGELRSTGEKDIRVALAGANSNLGVSGAKMTSSRVSGKNF